MERGALLEVTGALLLIFVVFLTGTSGRVLFAEGTVDLPDAGGTIPGAPTITAKQGAADKLYTQEINKRIMKIRPMTTPINRITHHVKTMSTKSMEAKYYIVDTRPIKGKLAAAFTVQTTGNTAGSIASDPDTFNKSDIIRVIGVMEYKEGGITVDTKGLVLCVSGTATSGNPLAYAVNGKRDGNGNPIWIPAIPVSTVIVRIKKACTELDTWASSFSNIPTPEVQYCQNLMTRVEQSTLDKL